MNKSILTKLGYLFLFNPIQNRLFSSAINRLKHNYTAKTENQKEYKRNLNNPNIDLVFCLGPAGSGKTLLACQHAIKLFQKESVQKIIITRPMVAIEEDMGYLPGNIKDKMHPWTIPVFDIFEEYYSKKELNSLVAENKIEIAPLGFMQGRTFKNSIIIADEMQNSTPNQMFMLLTRLGLNSKMIVTGDLMQTNDKNNGLSNIIQKLDNHYDSNNEELQNNKIAINKLTSSDIQRHSIVNIITELYKK